MSDFWKSIPTIQAERGSDYKAYSLFGATHLAELAVAVLAVVLVCLWYRRADEKTRRRILVGVTVLLLTDELLKHTVMGLTGQWSWIYLPLHLCSINLFICILHTWKGWSWCREELYSLGLPGAIIAMLLPSWQAASPLNMMHLHSVFFHILLILYPCLLIAGGFRPNPRRLPQSLLFLFGTGIPILFVDKALGTNFYFLNGPYSNILTTFFTGILGEEWYFLLFIPTAVLIVALMYLPWIVLEKREKRHPRTGAR